MKRLAVLFSIVAALALLLSSCAPMPTTAPAAPAATEGVATVNPDDLSPVLRWNLGAEPPTLDPSLATDTTSVQVDEALFLGLTDYDDATAEIVPELATDWSMSDDGLVWTFKMRQDVVWVHYDPATDQATVKGPVTAHDIEYGVKRTIDPATASDYAYVDYIIKNAYALNTGESDDMDSLGVKALDDYTIEFTLEQPAGYFPGIAGMWVNRPMPKAAIEEHGEKWTEAGNIWTNGPYMLESWQHESRLVVIKNPFYFDAASVQIAKVDSVMVVEDSTAFAMYENDELDVQDVPQPEMDRVRADPVLSEELYIAPRLCTYYYGFNTTKAPFDNVKVRQAFSYAFDRQKLIDTVTKGGQTPAKTLACPGIFGSPAEDPTFEGISFDPEKAKQLLAEAGYPNGEGLPEITLMYNTSEGHQRIAEFAQQSWKEILGVEVSLANQEWAVFIKTRVEDAPQIFRHGWCADYPDENNWVFEVFHPLKSSNEPKWDPESDSAQAFIEAVEAAAASDDPEERKALYFEAEQILAVDESIILPIYYYTRIVCTKPNIERGYAPMGGEHWAQWTIN